MSMDKEVAEMLTALYNAGYSEGHNDTVEGNAAHIVSGDETEYQRDVAEETEPYQSLLTKIEQLQTDNERLRIDARDVRHRNNCLQSDFSALERYRDRIKAERDTNKERIQQLEAVRDAAKSVSGIIKCEAEGGTVINARQRYAELQAALTAAEKA